MPEAGDSIFVVALSTMAPQYQGLYSHARETANFLLKQLAFERFARLYSSGLPPEVVVEEDGTSRLHSNEFYSYAGKRRVIMLAGDGSPFDDQQEYAHSVLSFARDLGAREVFSVGARWSESPTPAGAPVRPVGFASDGEGVKELEKLGVTVTKSEPGPFFSNLIVGMAGDYGMRGYKIGVDHGEPRPHPKSVIEIVRVLSEMAEFHVDTKELLSRAKEIETEEARVGLPEIPRERTGIYG
ncbi:MAG TPA: PAC2 family protein [Nitrososphaerales archaeon]|nr:PAC2 family protein [Nitrososphaerales archaeon]